MTPFDESGYPLTLAGDVSAEDDIDIDRPFAADLLRAELDDIAWCNKHGWPAGGS